MTLSVERMILYVFRECTTKDERYFQLQEIKWGMLKMESLSSI